MKPEKCPNCCPCWRMRENEMKTTVALTKLIWCGILGATIRERPGWIDIIFEKEWNGAPVLKIYPVKIY